MRTLLLACLLLVGCAIGYFVGQRSVPIFYLRGRLEFPAPPFENVPAIDLGDDQKTLKFSAKYWNFHDIDFTSDGIGGEVQPAPGCYPKVKP